MLLLSASTHARPWPLQGLSGDDTAVDSVCSLCGDGSRKVSNAPSELDARANQHIAPMLPGPQRELRERSVRVFSVLGPTEVGP